MRDRRRRAAGWIPALAGLLLAVGACASAPARPETSILHPESPAMNETAPESFQVRFETTRGDFVVESHREWAPHGVDRFYNLVRAGFYDDTRFFRVLDDFVAQFGLSGDPAVNEAWRCRTIADDPVTQNNDRGTVTFAMAGAGTRTTQLFVNLVDNHRLDSMGFAPIGEVVEGMDVVESLYSGYGEGPPRGRGPDQTRILTEGNDYLDRNYPDLDAIRSAEVVEEE